MSKKFLSTKNKVQLLSFIFLGVMFLSLFASSIPKVNALPHLITDNFDYDSFDSLEWVNAYSYGAEESISIDNGYLNLLANPTLEGVVNIDGLNSTWDTYNIRRLSEGTGAYYYYFFADSGVYGKTGYNFTIDKYISKIVLNWTGDDGALKQKVELGLNDEVVYSIWLNTTVGVDWNNTILYMDSIQSDSIIFTQFNDGAVTAFGIVECDLYQYNEVSEYVYRELESESSDFYFKTELQIDSFNAQRGYQTNFEILFSVDNDNVFSDTSMALQFYTSNNITYEIYLLIYNDGSVVSTWNYHLDGYEINSRIQIEVLVNASKGYMLKTTDLTNGSYIRMISYYCNEATNPMNYKYLVLDTNSYPQYIFKDLDIKFFYMTTYFYPEPISRLVNNDGIVLAVSSFTDLDIDTTPDGSEVLYYETFYKDLQSLHFEFRVPFKFYFGNDLALYFRLYAVYSDGSVTQFYYLRFRHQNSGTKTYITYIGSRGTEYNQSAGFSDLGINVHLEEEDKYVVETYATPRNHNNFTIWNSDIIAPDSTKELIGFKVSHIFYNSFTATTENIESRWENYQVTYGQDMIVPKYTFPYQEVDATTGTLTQPEGTGNILLDGIIFVGFALATIFYVLYNTLAGGVFILISGIIGGVIALQTFLGLALTALQTALYNVMDSVYTAVAGLVAGFIALAGDFLYNMLISIITYFVTVFDLIMVFFGLNFTYAQFVELILYLPVFLVQALSFLGYAVDFIVFAFEQVFIVIAVFEPYFDDFFFYANRFWLFALVAGAGFILVLCVEDDSFQPLLMFISFLVAIISFFVNIFIFVLNLILRFIDMLIKIIRG